MANITKVGQGKVSLLSGGGKVFTDIAARFVGSERSLDEIVGSEYNKNIVKNILKAGHLAATEFDYFVFGVEGYSRVTEVQLVRKRLASYCIKSGRSEKKGKRTFDIVMPKDDRVLEHTVTINSNDLSDAEVYIDNVPQTKDIKIALSGRDLIEVLEEWYNTGIAQGIAEEDLRYVKPQATEFKGIIGMSAHALLDFFQVRCCERAQEEIRDMAWKMLRLCKEAAPDLFMNAGPKCFTNLYCPENDFMPEKCKKKNIPTKDEVVKILKEQGKTVIYK